MREPKDVRRQRILAVVESRGEARLSDLADDLEVSVITVRRDVEDLASEGKLRRGHGIARSVGAVERGTPRAEPVAGGAGPAGQGGAVALMVPERHTYLYETMHGARSALYEAGMRVVLHIAPQVEGAERPLVERVLAEEVQGLLIAPRWRTAHEEEADYAWLAASGVPTVLMERRPRGGSALHTMDSVCTDHWYGIHLAVDHLVRLGHRRIVLAARDDSPTARALRAAFAEIAASRPEIEDWTVMLSAANAGPGRVREPLDLAARLRERGATGAVLHGDVDALMLVQQLTDHGVRVPQDCSVVAYDDVVAALGSTPLTAVSPPKYEVGRTAAGLLLRRLEELAGPGAGPAQRAQLLPELKVRGSTAHVGIV
ncbi:substrate-binding domain-containing protein [Streptomyces sp. NPDC059900]|uniref:substrate-binding domain-containing protein n=1 Tax=Streptomyces sp. NPDC059900 TaxID=3155816 RepID=UPI00343C392F